MTERWEPNLGDTYWYAAWNGEACSSKWNGFHSDTMYKKFGNCFKTEEEAAAAAEKVKALLLSLHEPARITPKTGQIWRNKISSQNYRVLFTSDWGTAEPYVTIGRIVKHLFDEPEEVQVEGQLFLMDFELVQEPEEEYLHKNPENLGTSSEPSQKVGTCQKTPISESLQQEDCKKRGFVRPSHEAPEHYKPDPKTGEWWRSKGDDSYIVKVFDGDYQLLGRRIVKYKNSRNIIMATNIEDFLERFEKEDGPILTLGEDVELIKPSHTTPEHYKLTPEPIDVIKGWDLGFCLGNVIKHIARAGRKAGESRDSDLHKAMEYLRMELEDEG